MASIETIRVILPRPIVTRITVGGFTQALTSVTSAEVVSLVQIASAAATSADAHANTVSARVVSVSDELASLVQIASAAATSVDNRLNQLSARSIGGSSVKGLQSVVNALSNRISAGGGGGGSVTSAEVASLVQVASAAATSADAHASTASAAATSADAHANTVSARLVSASAELGSLIQIASAAATSADTHANTASAAATSADAHANTASAAATSADNHANTVSARVVSVSSELASLVQIASAAATSADTHANTASAAATSVDNRIASLSTFFAGLSARSVGNVSTRGFQSIFNALSNRISAGGGGAGSVTSTELSAAKYILNTTQTDTDYTLVLGDAQTIVKMSSASAHNLTIPPNSSVAFPVGTQIVIEQAGTGTVTMVAGAGVTLHGSLVLSSQYATAVLIKEATDTWLVRSALDVTSLIQIASAAATSADAHANAVSARVVSVSAELASLVQIASAAATSADAHANTVSARVVSVSAELVSLFTSVDNKLSASIQTASAAATSADLHAAAASAAATSVNNRLNILSARSVGGTSVQGLQSVVNALSNRISAGGGGAGSVTSAEVVSLVQIASAAATSADAHANTVSARVVSVSAELASLIQIASAAATSADTHANTASAAATSADAHADTVSARVVSVSNELGSLLTSASAALETHANAASAAATSADAHANTVSARVVSVSAELVSLINSVGTQRAVNTAAQTSITVSTGLTVSGVSLPLTAGQSYVFEFFIPIVYGAANGLVVQVISPAATNFSVRYQVPNNAAQPGISPNAVSYFNFAGLVNTKYSTASITLTGVTAIVIATGTINPSGSGSLKFLIGPNSSNVAGNGVVVQAGSNVRVWRLS